MTESIPCPTAATSPADRNRATPQRIRAEHPRATVATMLVVEYTEDQAGGPRGLVDVIRWIAGYATFEHVNYGQPQHMASLVPCDVLLRRDAPALVVRMMRAARRQGATYVLFRLVRG
jgi:hypothetical protein